MKLVNDIGRKQKFESYQLYVDQNEAYRLTHLTMVIYHRYKNPTGLHFIACTVVIEKEEFYQSDEKRLPE